MSPSCSRRVRVSAPSAAAEVVPSVTGWTPSYFLDGDLGRCGPLRCPDWALLRVPPPGCFLTGAAGLASSGSSDLLSEIGSDDEASPAALPPVAAAPPDCRWDLLCRLGCWRLGAAALVDVPSSVWTAAWASLWMTEPSAWAARPALFRPLMNLRSNSLRSRPLATIALMMVRSLRLRALPWFVTWWVRRSR